MKNKRIIVFIVTLLLMLSTFTTAFAAELSLINKVTNKEHTVNEWGRSASMLRDVDKNPTNYIIEVGEKFYNLSQIANKMAIDKTITIEEAVVGLEPVEKPEVPTGDLKVVEVSAINNTSIVVNFNEVIEGEVAAKDFVFNNGLTVVNAEKQAGSRSVRLTTATQVAGIKYSLTYKGVATGKSFVGKEAIITETEYKITSAEARSNTSVVVELDNAPIKKLTKADFNISPALDIKSINTVGNIVTLSTEAQVAGRTYNITALNAGEGYATFVGKAPVSKDGIIKSVNVENLRQIRVDFNEPITWGTAKNEDNFYLGMLDDKVSTNIQTKSLKTIDANDAWRITSNGQIDERNVELKVNYVIIESKAGQLINETVANNGLGLELDKMATLEVRNLTRGYVNTSQVEFRVSDKKAPAIKEWTKEVEVGRLFKNVVATTTGDKYRSYVLADGSGAPITTTVAGDIDAADTKALLVVEYNEPITDMGVVVPANDKLQLRIDGTPIADSAAKIVKPLADNLVYQAGTVVESSTFILDVTGLSRGEHTLSITGTKDLNDNTQSPNTQNIKFTVVNEKIDVPAVTVPKVESVKQIADNAIEVVFNQPNVKMDTTDGEIKIGTKVYSAADIVPIVANTDFDQEKINVLYTNVNGKTIARFIMSPQDSGKYVFNDNTNQAIREIRLTNYKLNTQKGEVYSKDLLLKKDKIAPTVVKNGSFAVEEDAKLYIAFTDTPFAAPNGEIVFTSGKTLVVEMKEGNLNHATDEIATGKIKVVSETFANISTGTRETVLEIDLSGSTGLLNDGKLVKNAVYTVKFKDGDITDKEELVDSTNTNIKLLNLTDINVASALNEMAAIDVAVVVGAGVTEEGRVPQTKDGLIFTNTTAPTITGAGTILSSHLTAIDANEKNKIVVVFDGEVDKSVAENAANYTLDGKTLSSSTTINVYDEFAYDASGIMATIDGTPTGKTSFVVIELEEGTIPETGGYDFTVANITNKSGKRMLPVDVTLQLTDNTAPTLEKVEVRGDKQIQLTFDEALESSLTVVDANKNIEIRIDGAKMTIDTITVTGNIVDIELTSEIEGSIEDVKAEVTIKKAGGFMHILDNSVIKNKAKEVTVTN